MNLYWEFHVGLWYSDILLVNWYSKYLRSDGLMASRCDELSERDKSISLTSSRTLLVHSFEQDTVDPTNRYSLMLILFLRCLRHPLFDVWSPERRGYVQDMFCDVFMLQDVRDPCLFSWQLQQSMWMVRDSSWSLFVWFAAQAQSQDVNEAVLGFHLGVPYLSW